MAQRGWEYLGFNVERGTGYVVAYTSGPQVVEVQDVAQTIVRLGKAGSWQRCHVTRRLW